MSTHGAPFFSVACGQSLVRPELISNANEPFCERFIVKAVRGGALVRADGSVSVRIYARARAQALALGTLTRVPILTGISATVSAATSSALPEALMRHVTQNR